MFLNQKTGRKKNHLAQDAPEQIGRKVKKKIPANWLTKRTLRSTQEQKTKRQCEISIAIETL